MNSKCHTERHKLKNNNFSICTSQFSLFTCESIHYPYNVHEVMNSDIMQNIHKLQTYSFTRLLREDISASQRQLASQKYSMIPVAYFVKIQHFAALRRAILDTSFLVKKGLQVFFARGHFHPGTPLQQ